ncbi:peptidoglycan-binding protein [Streptomyces olivoreticuli]
MLKLSNVKRAAVVAASAGLALVALGGTASAHSTDSVIAYGDRGIGVKCVQLALNASNVHPGLDPDGVWGKRTEDAVRKFQQTNTDQWGGKLAVDGVIGTNTGHQLMELIVHNEHDWGNTCWENMPS